MQTWSHLTIRQERKFPHRYSGDYFRDTLPADLYELEQAVVDGDVFTVRKLLQVGEHFFPKRPDTGSWTNHSWRWPMFLLGGNVFFNAFVNSWLYDIWVSMVTIVGPFMKFIGSCGGVHCGVLVWTCAWTCCVSRAHSFLFESYDLSDWQSVSMCELPKDLSMCTSLSKDLLQSLSETAGWSESECTLR